MNKEKITFIDQKGNEVPEDKAVVKEVTLFSSSGKPLKSQFYPIKSSSPSRDSYNTE